MWIAQTFCYGKIELLKESFGKFCDAFNATVYAVRWNCECVKGLTLQKTSMFEFFSNSSV